MTTDCASRCDKKPMLKCTTEMYSFSFTWKFSDIEVQTLILTNGTNIQSSIFSRGTDDEINWRLKLERYFENGLKSFNLKLCLVSSDIIELESVCKFSLCDIQQPIWEGKYKFTTLGQDLTIENINFFKWYYPGMMLHFSVNCGIDAVISRKPIISKCNCRKTLELIFKNEKFTDVTLCASGKEFRAHKVILAARSPVFNAMFDHEMDEKKQNRVDITDIDGDIFGEFLRYIYTEEVVNLKNFAIGLLSAADKYGLENLKVLCENELCTNISIENAAEVLVLADLHNVMKLRALAIKYICSNAENVTMTDGWKLMTESHSNLVAEIVCYLAQQRAIKPSTD